MWVNIFRCLRRGNAGSNARLARNQTAEIDLDARVSFWDTPAPVRPPDYRMVFSGPQSYVPRRRSHPMKLNGELRSSSSAWQFSAIVAICLLITGCNTLWHPEPTAGRWWGGSGPNTTVSQEKDDPTEKSRSMPWFGTRKRDEPRTVNEWMDQTSPVHP